MNPSRLLNWIFSLGSDAVGRFVLQLGATIIFARLLTPEEFGQAALVVVLMSVLSILVTAPFEEGLVQQRRIRKIHFSAALAALFGVAVLLFAMTTLVALSLDEWLFGVTGTGPLLAVFALILFADGPYAVFCAAARRRRRFAAIAAANISGLAVGTAVGLMLVFAGAGVWSLLAVRLVARYVAAARMAYGAGYRILPAWSPQHLRSSAHFSGWYFADRCTTNLTDAIFQSLVTALLGLTANGYLNMAMRIVEPIRGASGAISHNLSMAYFTRLNDAPERMRDTLEAAVQRTAVLLLPMFLGLAAVAPALIVLLAGPEWLPAGPIAVLLAVSAAIISPTEFVQTAVTSRGRSELGFATSLTGLFVTAISMLLLAPLGVIAAGFSRLAYYSGDAIWGVALAQRLFGISPIRFLGLLWQIIAASLVMVLALAGLRVLLPADLPLLVLIGTQVVCGVTVYALSVWLLAPAILRDTVSQLVGKTRRA